MGTTPEDYGGVFASPVQDHDRSPPDEDRLVDVEDETNAEGDGQPAPVGVSADPSRNGSSLKCSDSTMVVSLDIDSNLFRAPILV